MLIGHGGEKFIVVRLFADYAGQAEYIPRRIVGVNSHIYARLVTRGHYSVEEIYEILKQFFVSNALVFFKQAVKLRRGITFVPSGKAQIVLIEFFKILLAIRKRGRPVGMFIV